MMRWESNQVQVNHQVLPQLLHLQRDPAIGSMESTCEVALRCPGDPPVPYVSNYILRFLERN